VGGGHGASGATIASNGDVLTDGVVDVAEYIYVNGGYSASGTTIYGGAISAKGACAIDGALQVGAGGYAGGVGSTISAAGALSINGAAKLGAGSNHADFSSAGILRLNGTARAWEDLRIDPQIKATGAGQAAYAVWKTNYYLLAFPDGADTACYFTAQMPHAWDTSTDPVFHVHWVSNGSSTTNKFPEWNLVCRWAGINGDFDADISPSAVRVPAGKTIGDAIAADTHYVTAFAALDASAAGGDSISSILIGKLSRSAAPLDDYPDDVSLLYVDLHYQVNSLGSDAETSKT